MNTPFASRYTIVRYIDDSTCYATTRETLPRHGTARYQTPRERNIASHVGYAPLSAMNAIIVYESNTRET